MAVCMCRMGHLISGLAENIFTYRSILVYPYDPFGQNTVISSHTASKIIRWALELYEFRNVIEHVCDEMSTQLAVRPKSIVPQGQVGNATISALMFVQINASYYQSLDCPTANQIRES